MSTKKSAFVNKLRDITAAQRDVNIDSSVDKDKSDSKKGKISRLKSARNYSKKTEGIVGNNKDEDAFFNRLMPSGGRRGSKKRRTLKRKTNKKHRKSKK